VEHTRRNDQERCPSRSISIPHLRRLRQRKALSQRELGQLAKVSPGTVHRLENELRGAYPVTVRKLASALGVPPAELLREPRPRQEEPMG
jgi:transcriptional regulator with XRE-family HTH domain